MQAALFPAGRIWVFVNGVWWVWMEPSDSSTGTENVFVLSAVLRLACPLFTTVNVEHLFLVPGISLPISWKL